ncbi:MAG TPA: hypothetical protein VN903_11530 [Polyangia bacterium]|jgi:hypothetical protein|nr:hypothetical protein [Polyangia bacterium]
MRFYLSLAAVIALFSGGCRSLQLEEGKLPCSKAGECPAPYVCWSSDNKCHRHPQGDGGVDRADTAVDGNPGDVTDGGEAGTVKQPNGHGCAADAECTSGFCRDGVCCNDMCAGACKACARTYTGMNDGTCANAVGGSNPRDMCLNETADLPCGLDGTCDGTGQCRKVPANKPCGQPTCSSDGHTFMPVGTCSGTGTCTPGMPQDCGMYACASTGCAKPCAGPQDCPTTQYCSSSGTCKTKKVLGTGCGAASECDSGFCSTVDLVCCDKACTDSCTSCLKMHTAQADGTCAPVQLGLDPHNDCSPDDVSTCGKDGNCDGRGACHLFANGTGCGPGSCSGATFTPAKTCNGAGVCGPSGNNVNCGQSACSVNGCLTMCSVDTDCAASSYCNTTSRQCAAKKANGATCNIGKECINGACVENVCCDTACNGKCVSCLGARTGGADGTCAYAKVGTDPKNDCDPTDASTCGLDGFCDGAGQCEKWSSSTVCATGMCGTGNFTPQRTCSQGACAPAMPMSCGAAACDPTSGCRTTCSKDADCVGNNYCDLTTMKCAAQKVAGSMCNGNTQCTTGYCVDSVCCSSMCNGTCSSCRGADTGLADGMCGFVKNGTDPGNECAADATPCGHDGFCNGSGACRFTPANTLCGSASCSGSTLRPASKCDGAGTCQPQTQVPCDPYVCNGTTACYTSCTADTQCVNGDFCGSSMCQVKKTVGGSCGGNNQCMNSMCSVDGVCCNSACTASCQGCSMANTGQPSGMCWARSNTAPLVAVCANACPYGYALCSMAGSVTGCGRTLWNMEGGRPAIMNSLEWNPGEAGIDYVTARAHGGTHAAVILSDSNNYNASPNVYPCDDQGATMDMRGKTITVWLLADGPTVAGATCSMTALDANFSDVQAMPNFNITTFGQWFTITMPLGNTAGAVANIGFQCYFGAWPGSLYFDDVSVN